MTTEPGTAPEITRRSTPTNALEDPAGPPAREEPEAVAPTTNPRFEGQPEPERSWISRREGLHAATRTHTNGECRPHSRVRTRAASGHRGAHDERRGPVRSWLDIPQVSRFDTRITPPDGRRAYEGEQWPARAERIEIDTVWNLNGTTTRKTLATDLAFGRTDISNPRFAYPFVTEHSRLTSQTPEKLILVAYSGADQYEPDAEELAQHRATARAAVDIALHGLDGWLTAVKRLVEERLLYCLQADVRPAEGIRILLHDESTAPIKTERYSRKDPLRKPIGTDPVPARERDNRLRYEHGPFDGHRGILLGTPVTPHSKLWRTLVEMYDERRGRRLWEPESPIHGRVMELDLKLRGMAADEGIENGRYGAVWVAKTRRLPNRTRLSRMATSGADPDRPGPVAVHVLSAVEHDELRKRVLGPLMQAIVDREAERQEHAAERGHPVRELLAECEARRDTNLAAS